MSQKNQIIPNFKDIKNNACYVNLFYVEKRNIIKYLANVGQVATVKQFLNRHLREE